MSPKVISVAVGGIANATETLAHITNDFQGGPDDAKEQQGFTTGAQCRKCWLVGGKRTLPPPVMLNLFQHASRFAALSGQVGEWTLKQVEGDGNEHICNLR